MPAPQVEVQEVFKSFPSGEGALPVLRGVNLALSPGEFVAVVGASGSGKSTLLHLIAGLDRADAGRIVVHGRELTGLSDKELALYRRNGAGVVFQFFNLFSSLSVLENVMMPGIIRRAPPRDIRSRADELLEKVGLAAKAGQKAMELSGGEMQRVSLARALLNRPPLLLADEPTGNLDSENRKQVYSLLKSLRETEGTTVLLVTHERELSGLADRVVEIVDGRMLV